MHNAFELAFSVLPSQRGATDTFPRVTMLLIHTFSCPPLEWSFDLNDIHLFSRFISCDRFEQLSKSRFPCFRSDITAVQGFNKHLYNTAALLFIGPKFDRLMLLLLLKFIMIRISSDFDAEY